MLLGVQGLVSCVCKKPADPYQPAASCSPNYCWCDNYSPSLISHLIAKVYFLLSRARFNPGKPPLFPSADPICAAHQPGEQARSHKVSRLSRQIGRETSVQISGGNIFVIYMSGLMSGLPNHQKDLVGRDRRGSWSHSRWFFFWARWSVLFWCLKFTFRRTRTSK